MAQQKEKLDIKVMNLLTNLDTSNKATRRVIAPYVKVVRKNYQKQKAIVDKMKAQKFEIIYKRKPEDMFIDLKAFLSDTIDLPVVMHQSTEVLRAVTNSTGITLYMVDESTQNEIYLVPKNIKSERHKINWKIEPGSTIAAFVAYKKEYIMVDDLLNDDRFPKGLGYQDENAKSVLCVPILTPEGDCFGVIELFRHIHLPSYNSDDLKIAIVVSGWMGAAIHQNKERVAMEKQQRINDCLLDLIKCFFTSDLPLTKMIAEIMKLAKASLKAQKGSFFVIDPESEDLSADVFEEGLEDDGMYKKNVKVKLMKDKGIAGLVARQGITIKLNDVYKHSRHNREVDDKTGMITRCIMSTPILSGNDVIGVVQVVNKTGPTDSFNRQDENLFKVISVYCALALHFDKLRREVRRNNYFNECYVELLQKHIKPCIHDITHFGEHLEVEFPPGFHAFNWYIPPKLVHFMPQYCIFMFLEIIGRKNLDLYYLMQFILTVKKMYRNNPYHNFEHAFTVTHCMYNILLKNRNLFTYLESLSLIISTICHDIDHRGITNNFLQVTNDNLAMLYEENILENHHIKVTTVILNDCPLLHQLSKDEYKIILKEIRENILATDLSLYFRIRAKIYPLLVEGNFDWDNEVHRSYLKNMMMTASDLSGNCKPFLTAKTVMNNLYKEFYAQGDIEKNLGLCPLSLMDREKDNLIPEDQVQFINVLILPCAEILKTLLPSTFPLYDEAFKLRASWLEIIEMKGSKHWRQFESVVNKRLLQED